jgi:TrmH family RNA methyltransferase
MPEEIEQEQLAARKGLIIATDAIQDPGNLGTIIRTASWFGVQGLLLGKGTVDHFHPKVVRSTAGATGSIPFIDRDLKELLPLFEGRGWRVVLLDTGAGSSPLRELKTRGKTIIVVGNEANGIDPLLYVNGRKRTRISSPRKTESVESLNAAIATSIALYALV